MKYKVIYADPAWSYRDKCNAGERGAGFKYATLSIDQIKAMPVAELADPEGCALFLWATYPLLPEAIEVLRAWGFAYKVVAFTWVKLTKNGKPFFGMGNWTRSNPEIVLLGTRGKIKRVNAGVPNFCAAPIQEHSRKPDAIAERIVKLMGDVSRVELFARRPAPGWHVWGNQVESDIEIQMP